MEAISTPKRVTDAADDGASVDGAAVEGAVMEGVDMDGVAVVAHVGVAEAVAVRDGRSNLSFIYTTSACPRHRCQEA